MDKPKLLIVEDDPDLRTQLKWGLSGEYRILTAEDRPRTMELVKAERPPVVTLDLGLPPEPAGVAEGFSALAEILEREPLTKVIIVTARNEKEHALKAIGGGAYDFLTKPIDLEELQVILRRAFHVADLERENRELQKRVRSDAFEGMLGTSPQILKVFDMIRKVAGTEQPILITGESGTGKELAARAVHNLSARKGGPFIAINCGAIPENLLESELFGHEKGAFTGAHIQRRGRIESAQGGTLFLDEIAEMPPILQVKLLRFLQEQRIERVGGREEISVDVRVLAATNVDLAEALREGRFRDDLYYRLGVVVIPMPPLRQREGDVLLLAKALLHRHGMEIKGQEIGFTAAAIRAVDRHSWPGNIRELENRIKRAVIMSNDSKVTPSDLELDSPFTQFAGQSLKDAREALDREMIQNALNKADNNLTRAAAELGISRPSLYDLMDKLGIPRK
jgi:two-component system NtrC family response regulator